MPETPQQENTRFYISQPDLEALLKGRLEDPRLYKESDFQRNREDYPQERMIKIELTIVEE